MAPNQGSALASGGEPRRADIPSRPGKFSLVSLAPRALSTRLALTYAGLVVLIMLALGWSLAGTVRAFSIAQIREDLSRRTESAADTLEPLLVSPPAEELADEVAELAAISRARVSVLRPDGTVLADSGGTTAMEANEANRPEIREALQSGEGIAQRAGGADGESFLYAARRVGDGAAIVRLGIPLDEAGVLVQDIQRQIAIAALLAAALMSGAGWFVARRIGAALEDLRAQATAVAAGSLDASVVPVATRELGDVGRAFNVMTARLRETVSEREQMRVRLEATLANLSDGVLITDERGRVVHVNAAARSMLAITGPVAQEPFVEVARDHELAAMVSAALDSTGEVQEQVVHHGRSGRLLQAAARLLDATSERIGVVVLRDITELRRLEAVRRDFVANVSHELRTPLTSIRALVETLEAGAIDDPSVSADFLARIVAEVDRLAAMVDELLDLARLESGRLQLSLDRVESRALVEHAIQRLTPQIERAGLSVEATFPPQTLAVIADRDRIEQVLLNLIHNAIKFTPSGGTITLCVRDAEPFVEFQVRDTGVGVSPDDMPRLFERFYKTDRARRSEGTGLGLAIAKHIVQGHSGAIWAEPNPGGGTVFIFRLPASDGPGADSPTSVAVAAPDNQTEMG
jgi:two-component system phosphate regulon sensor histidine kinase PhoR